jgi:hypothetical protein
MNNEKEAWSRPFDYKNQALGRMRRITGDCGCSSSSLFW